MHEENVGNDAVWFVRHRLIYFAVVGRVCVCMSLVCDVLEQKHFKCSINNNNTEYDLNYGNNENQSRESHEEQSQLFKCYWTLWHQQMAYEELMKTQNRRCE